MQESEDDEDVQPFARLFARVSQANSVETSGSGVSMPVPKPAPKPRSGPSAKQPSQKKNTNAANASTNTGGNGGNLPDPDKRSEKGEEANDDGTLVGSDDEPLVAEPKNKRVKGAKQKPGGRTSDASARVGPGKEVVQTGDGEDMNSEDREVVSRFEALVQEHEMNPGPDFAQWSKDS